MAKLPTPSDWTSELIEQYYLEIERIARDVFKLDTYPNQIEIISSEQMMEAYSSVAMPVMYDHWSFGKQFLHTFNNYKKGRMGLAYEVVINSSPCIAYLMEENTMLMQALVMAHACFGHNAVFKNNYLFKQWTDAEGIIDYLIFAKKYIRQCEEKYGDEEVEKVLDSCHALMNYGVDRYKRPSKLSAEEEKKRMDQRREYRREQVNELWRTIPNQGKKDNERVEKRFPEEPQENILYFIEKNAPHLETWKREIIRIVRKVSQYFYPQKQTKVLNEGYATFMHYNIMHEMKAQGLIDDKFMLEFYHMHTGVVAQPSYQYSSSINVYALGFAIFQDIKRICMDPTDEDREWFDFAGNGDWLKTTDWAMRSFKDESFILQFLSPKVIRDLGLFVLMDDEQDDEYEITAIHNKKGYKRVREVLAKQFDITTYEPVIQVYSVDIRGDRSLTLHHNVSDTEQLLDQDSTEEILKHIQTLWQFNIHIEEIYNDEIVNSYSTDSGDLEGLYDMFSSIQ